MAPHKQPGTHRVGELMPPAPPPGLARDFRSRGRGRCGLPGAASDASAPAPVRPPSGEQRQTVPSLSHSLRSAAPGRETNSRWARIPGVIDAMPPWRESSPSGGAGNRFRAANEVPRGTMEQAFHERDSTCLSAAAWDHLRIIGRTGELLLLPSREISLNYQCRGLDGCLRGRCRATGAASADGLTSIDRPIAPLPPRPRAPAARP